MSCTHRSSCSEAEEDAACSRFGLQKPLDILCTQIEKG